MIGRADNQTLSRHSFAFDAGAAPAFWLVETLWTVLASGIQTDNRIGVMEQAMGPGLGPPTHRHPRASEGFYVLEGICRFNMLGTSRTAGPGTLVHLPRSLPHSFSVESAEAHVLNFYMPACFEVMIMACGILAPERRRPTMAESAPPQSTEQLRLLSNVYGQEAVTALPFLQPSKPELMQTSFHDHSNGDPVIVTAAEVEPRHSFDLTWRRLLGFDQTGGSHEISEVSGSGAAGPPPLTGLVARALYVLDGSVDIGFGENRQTLTSGGFAYLRPGDDARWALAEASRLLVIDMDV